ncbi:unnamed protein product [Prorocentrum cordatum]|uniref:Uncharacterized protein n=1 Tax=Prorocentrum cordatum TaxID=2364126 RepID=A0ABN9QH45_9DINO|nr:unnamed protein product [Polarella glacialis]
MEAATQNYSDEGAQRKVFASVCAIWFVLGGCVLLVRKARQEEHTSQRLSVSSYLGRLFGSCVSLVLFLAGTVEGPSAKQVAQELQHKRLLRGQASIPYGCAAVAVFLGVGMFRAVMGMSRLNSVVQDICMLVGCFAVLFLWAYPRSLTLRTLDMWSSFLILVVVIIVSPFASEGVFANSHSLLPFGATMVVCLFNMNVRFNFIWLLMVSLSICSSIYVDTQSTLGGRLPGRAQRISTVLMATFVFAIVVAFFHKSVYLVVQYDMEANTSRNELKAARSVLRSVCDAVVELDGDFRLQDGSSELVDMLLLNPLRPLLGEDLRQFLASQQDREKFSEQLGRAWPSSEDTVGLSAAFHVSMKDSSSIALDVEVFGVRFVNREGQAAYFVGIREFTDTAPMLRDSGPERTRHGGGRSGPRRACTACFRQPAAPADSTAAASSQASSDVSSEPCSLDESWEDPGAEEEPVAWVDVLTPNYSVRLASPAFAKYVEARGELLTAMRQSQHDQFIDWAQEAYFACLEEGPGSAGRTYHRRLHFRSPAQQKGAHSSMGSRPMLSALLQLDLTRPPDGQDRGRGVVRIVLQDILLGRRVPPGPRRPSRCGTPAAIAQAASGRLAREAALAGGPAPQAVRLVRGVVSL